MCICASQFDDLCPPEENVVRAEIILGGYIMEPTAKGTKLQYVVQVGGAGGVEWGGWEGELGGSVGGSVGEWVHE